MSKVSPRRLGDLITLKRGYDLPEKDRIPGPYPVISSAGVSGFHNEYKVEGQGVVTGRYGTLGEMYFVEDKYWPHNTALYVQNFKGNDPKYIYYLLSCLGRIRTSDKSAVPGVNRNELHEMAIPAIDDRKLQVAIRKVLEAIDKKIELNNRINAELEAMAKTLYDYWFVQFDFPDDSPQGQGKPYKSSGGEMVYNPTLKREIPEGWDDASLVDIATFTNGIACQKYYPTGDEPTYKVIKIREFSSGFDDSSESVHQGVPEKVVVNDGDILFSWSATLEVKLWAGGTGALNQHIFKVTSESYPKTFYYFEVLKYLEYFKMVAELRKTTMGHITKDHLVTSRICLPPKDLIKAMDAKLSPILSKIISNSQQNAELEKLRDWLLPMLMNGQVTVREAS
ncbi:TPA: restriction endonuclease subunit S [Vibrio parahaemolyticus]|nr:restriction endonuclease subunit S [Vibrio parahaemolyticus]HCG9362379.1 restriction endonuclease subunit S [Vibrio parahaemolyticus]HCG9403878.1 restriction endonuclease subunit S [Vibrio parahaemolyticus]